VRAYVCVRVFLCVYLFVFVCVCVYVFVCVSLPLSLLCVRASMPAIPEDLFADVAIFPYLCHTTIYNNHELAAVEKRCT